MKNPRILELMTREWNFLFLIMLCAAKSEDQTGMPEAGSLCISDCESCPVICAPPPPPVNSKPLPPPPLPPPQPPVHHHSPPQPYYFGSPPLFSLPEPPPSPPPPRRPTCPPPPPPKSVGVPKDYPYPYPYYYFYASKAASVPHLESIFCFLLLFISSFVLLG